MGEKTNGEAPKRADESITEEMLGLFVTDEAYRLALVGEWVDEKRWEALGDFLAKLQKDRMPLWVDYFCAALDEVTPLAAYDQLYQMMDEHGIYDYPVMLQMHLRESGGEDLQVVAELALRFTEGKLSMDGYYYRMALLGEFLRLGLEPGPVFEQMDLDGAEYVLGRITQDEKGRWASLRKALEEWQREVRPEAGEMERYLAMRLSEMIYFSGKKAYREEPDKVLASYRTAMERRYEWEEEHRAPGMCEKGGSVALPVYVRGVCAMRTVFRLEEEGNALAALISLRSAVVQDIGLGEIAYVMSERLTRMLEQQVEAGEVEDIEYEQALLDVKQKIELLIRAGHPHEVIGMLSELERMVPGDDDVRRLKILAGILPPS